MNAIVHETEINLCVPFVNDAEYMDSLVTLAKSHKSEKSKIYEVYGALPQDPIGNLRPPDSVRPMSVEQLSEHIKKLHRHGIRFNYVMNSELMPIPLTEAYRDDVLTFLRELSDIGVDEVTLTVPYLIGLVKKHYPEMIVNASICNEIASVREAIEFKELGADVIVMDRDANRDFSMLREIRSQIDGGIKLLCNSACVFHCINVHYHGSYSSALSNSAIGTNIDGSTELSVPYCNYYCRHRFFSNPSELIRMNWIRPEDMKLYAKEGINLFKIDGRDKDPSYLLFVIKAYLEMNYIGNFFHMLQPEFCEDVSEIQGTHDCNDTTTIQPSADTLVKQTEIFLKESEKWFVGIRNSDLDGFMDAFANEKIVCCGNCIKCGYCDIFAKKNVINPVWQQKMIRLMNYNLARYYG